MDGSRTPTAKAATGGHADRIKPAQRQNDLRRVSTDGAAKPRVFSWEPRA